MKRKTLSVAVFSLLFLFSGTPAFSCQSSPISSLTPAERAIMAGSTWENSADVLKGAKCFSVNAKGLLKIEYSNGFIRYLASSDAGSPVTERSGPVFIGSTPRENELHTIFADFVVAWHFSTGDTNAQEYLQKADELASQYIRLTALIPEAADGLERLAARGNRYIFANKGIGLSPAIMDLVPFLDEHQLFNILCGYFGGYNSRIEDRPTGDENLYIFRQLKDRLAKEDLKVTSLQNEIKSLDPTLYQELFAGTEE